MTRARGVLVLGIAAVTMLVAAPTAAAEPFTFAIAKDGQLFVSSSVLVGGRTVEMMGGWVNESQNCTRRRRLAVDVLIDRVRAGNTTRFEDERTGLVMNCAEGGPNFGFQLTATDVGMACPNGKWRPGRYSFDTSTLFRSRHLTAIASLSWVNRERC
jgi:hypothetical protein